MAKLKNFKSAVETLASRMVKRQREITNELDGLEERKQALQEARNRLYYSTVDLELDDLVTLRVLSAEEAEDLWNIMETMGWEEAKTSAEGIVSDWLSP